MSASRLIRLAFTLAAAAFTASAFAQYSAPGGAPAPAAAPAFEPTVGQEGKDVVWVPTPQALVDKMLDMAKVTAADVVMDLGSGDGRTVITAAKRGARAYGIEYNPDMVALSKQNAEKAGMSSRATFTKADLFETDFSKATVITMFLLPEINLKLRPKLLNLRAGTRVVSNSFTMGDWEPDEKHTLDDKACKGSSWCTAMLWIVPAKVAGSYHLQQGELTLKQSFQMLSGTLRTDGKTHTLEGKVNGDQVSFKAGGKEYRGRMQGKELDLR